MNATLIKMATRRAVVIVLAGNLAACAGHVREPQAGVMDIRWTDALVDQLPVAENTLPPLRERISDPQLKALVDSALAENLDVQVVRERVVEARALSGAALARYRPQLGVNASVTDQQLSENGLLPAGRIPGFESDQTIYDAGFDASWELGLFGRRAAASRDAELGIDALTTELAGAEESLVAEILRRYIDYQRAAREVALRDEAIAIRADQLEVSIRRHARGEASDLDVELARAQRQLAQAQKPAAVRSRELARIRLAVLTGQSPATLTLKLKWAPEPLWRGQAGRLSATSDTLRRRPDVRLAEVRYAQAVLATNRAQLDFFPQVALFANAGFESTATSSLLDSASLARSVGGLLEWALLDGGQRQVANDAATSREMQSSLAYRAALLGALGDLEESVASLTQAQAELAQHRALARTRETVHRMQQARRDGGTAARSDVLAAHGELVNALLSVTALEAQVLTERLRVEKALGAL